MKNSFLLTAVLLMGLLACRKDSVIDSGDARIRITADTLHYDTVFAQTGSVTKSFKIINENSQRLRLSEVKLMGLDQSNYKLNIDGQATSQLNNIEIAANDSIYVFVQVNIDPNSAQLPFVVRDSIRVAFNGNERWVQLEAWGQNAHFLRGYEVTGLETWTNDLPYVILDYLYVAENSKLYIDAGCRLYMHANAPIIVDGSLWTNGGADSAYRVYFQGDRLDEPYRNYPASWPGIYFRESSTNNFLRYAVIRNAYQALITEGGAALNPVKLELDACVVDNAYDAGIWAVNSSVKAVNSLISNCGKNLLVEGGGSYEFTHCTIATISGGYIDHKDPVVTLRDQYLNTLNPLSASFVNGIIWGEGGLVENEVAVTHSGPATNVLFDHILWKQAVNPAGATVVNYIPNQNPLFDSIDVSKRIFNFRLKENSPARQAGLNAGILTDLDGRTRLSTSPDLGAYERP
jgi:hypothetical protein